MFRLTHPLPEKCLVAVSGGIDSMAAWHWLHRSNHVDEVVHINHGTGRFADYAEEFVTGQAEKLGTTLRIFRLGEKNQAPPGKSQEEHWRDLRYQILDTLGQEVKLPVVLGHQLNDCAEEYLICAVVRGYFGTIPYRRGVCVRPFRTWSRDAILEYTTRHGIEHVEDPSNDNTKFLRNKVRAEILPRVLEANPGFFRIVERAIEFQDQR